MIELNPIRVYAPGGGSRLEPAATLRGWSRLTRVEPRFCSVQTPVQVAAWLPRLGPWTVLGLPGECPVFGAGLLSLQVAEP
jgi:hypothetical protein